MKTPCSLSTEVLIVSGSVPVPITIMGKTTLISSELDEPEYHLL